MAHYFRSTGTNWGTVGDWSSTPSPSYTAVAAVPTVTDDVIFEAASGNCIVNSINRVCKSISFATYTNTIQMTFNITVSGSVTFGASMNVHATGSGIMIMNATGTLTSNGYIWPNEFRFNGTNLTYTIASDMTFGGVLSTTGAVTAVTLAGARTITCNSGVTVTAPVFLGGAGTTIRIAGGTTSGNFFNCDLVLYSGTITLSGTLTKSGASFIYTAGTVTATSCLLSLSGAVTVSLGSNVVFGGGCAIASSGVYTFNDDLWIAGTLSLTGASHISTYNTTTSKKIYCWGLSGTTSQNDPFLTSSTRPAVEFNGTGNIAWAGNFGLPVIINTLGTLNFSSTLTLGSVSVTTTATYVSGNITTSGTASTFIFNCLRVILNMSSYTLPSGILFTASVTFANITLLSNLNFTGTLTIVGGVGSPINGAFNVNIGGGLNLAGTGAVNGTASLRLIGTGTWSSSSNQVFTQSLEIDTLGSITLSGTINHTGNLLYTKGTIISSGSTFIRGGGTMTINAPGFNLGTLNLTGFSLFLGTNGFTISTLNCSTTGVHSVWKSGNEYTISTAFNSGQADGINRITYTSSLNKVFTGAFSGTQLVVSAVQYGTIAIGDEIFGTGISQGRTITSLISGTLGGIGTYGLSGGALSLTSRTVVSTANSGSQPKITLQNGATQNLYYSNALDIDSTGGQTIWTFGSNLLRAFNWGLGTKPTQKANAWVN